MNDEELGHEIARRLDESLEQMAPRVTQGLSQARAQAIARRAKSEGIGAGVVHALSRVGAPRILAPMFGLVLALLGMLYWQESQRLESNYADNADIDAQMLTDELPVTAYLDQGFEIWLYHQTPADAQQ